MINSLQIARKTLDRTDIKLHSEITLTGVELRRIMKEYSRLVSYEYDEYCSDVINGCYGSEDL